MAYHSATLMGTEIWIVGGSDDKHTSSHVYVLNTGTLQWRTVSIRYAPVSSTCCVTGVGPKAGTSEELPARVVRVALHTESSEEVQG